MAEKVEIPEMMRVKENYVKKKKILFKKRIKRRKIGVRIYRFLEFLEPLIGLSNSSSLNFF